MRVSKDVQERKTGEREWVRRERKSKKRDGRTGEREKQRNVQERGGETPRERERRETWRNIQDRERESERNRGNLSGREARESDNYKKE